MHIARFSNTLLSNVLFSTSRIHLLLVIAASLVFSGVDSGADLATQASTQVFPRSLEFHAEKVKAKHIDDVINKMAPDGWMPAFILDDELRKRVIFRRPLDPARQVKTLEYQAMTVGGMMKELEEVVNTQATDGWLPVFITRDTFKHRIIFARDKTKPTAETEYMKLIVDESRHLDDAFNHHGTTGWEPKFVIEYGERFHVLFRRKKGIEHQPKRYRALKTLATSLIDNTYDELAAEGWQPLLTFQDGERYRMLFVEHPNATRLQYFADRVTKIKHLDDSFSRWNEQGWHPIFVFQFSADTTLLTEEEQFRLLFARVRS
ncbi:MAG: hypothetical protein AB8G77_25245 [Rhodothermales bacterium]